MNAYEVDLTGRRRRRRHSAEFKRAVIDECTKPGVSMAGVALRHGLNATMVRKWVVEAERKLAGTPSEAAVSVRQMESSPAPAFVPLTLPAVSAQGDIRIDLKRAGTVMSIAWPVTAAPECAAWLRELLR